MYEISCCIASSRFYSFRRVLFLAQNFSTIARGVETNTDRDEDSGHKASPSFLFSHGSFIIHCLKVIRKNRNEIFNDFGNLR